jgi:hypothetical protein
VNTKLIELEDGTLVMVDVSENEARPISGGAADRVAASFDKIKPILKNACKPVSEVFKELNREMEVGQAEISLGLSFEGEGKLFVVTGKAGANLNVKLTLKPVKDNG